MGLCTNAWEMPGDGLWLWGWRSMLKNNKKSILILVNHDVVIYNFRLELVERLLAEEYDVHISSPYGERICELVNLGAVYHETFISRHGMNPKDEMAVMLEYKKLVNMIKPIVVLGFTIKPNIYGALAAKSAGLPFIANITGLGIAVEKRGWKQKAAVVLYRIAFTNVQRVFFQNKENMKFFRKHHIAIDKHALLPGSGVNLQRFAVAPQPECGNGRKGKPVKFAFISRIMEEKGIEQYLAAAEKIRRIYPSAEFHVCGFCEDGYKGRLEELHEKGVVKYHGMIRDVNSFMSRMHCIVHPTYYPEGLSNVLLEACACGRAVISTDRAGCREVIHNGVNGYLVPEKNVQELTKAIEKFIRLDNGRKAEMGKKGRELAEYKFSREIVVNAYMDEIYAIDKTECI